jgi:hypothetical protein
MLLLMKLHKAVVHRAYFSWNYCLYRIMAIINIKISSSSLYIDIWVPQTVVLHISAIWECTQPFYWTGIINIWKELNLFNIQYRFMKMIYRTVNSDSKPFLVDVPFCIQMRLQVPIFIGDIIVVSNYMSFYIKNVARYKGLFWFLTNFV